MNEIISKLNFFNLIKGSKFIETIKNIDSNRKISPVTIWKSYVIGKKTSANAILLYVSLIHSLKDLYPYLEIIRLIMALYNQRLQEIIEPKIFKQHYDHYFKCLTVQTKEEDDELSKSEEYKIYIKYFWELFPWIKIELTSHAFDILGNYSYDDYEDSLLDNINVINNEIKSLDLNLIYKNKCTNKYFDTNENCSTQYDDKFIINLYDNNLNIIKDTKRNINIDNIKLISKDDNYLDDHQLIRSNLSIENYFSLKIDVLDAKLLYDKFDFIFKKIFYYDSPMFIIIDDIYHLDKPPPKTYLQKYNQIL